MHKQIKTDQRGFAPVGIILLALLVVAVAGFVGSRIMNADKSVVEEVAETVASIQAGEECMKQYDDQDICKFLSSWNVNPNYKLVSTNTYDGETTTTEMTIDGENTYMKMDGAYPMEIITMGDTTYTKAGDTWWKQTKTEAETTTEPPVDTEDFNFEEPTESSREVDTTKYVLVTKEACGDLTCFKYQVVDPSNTESTEYIWFDDKDYLIRKSTTENADGSKSESVFSYDDASVTEPSPVKELGPDQYIVPGETEPQTMPSQPTDAEMQALIDQYSQ